MLVVTVMVGVTLLPPSAQSMFRFGPLHTGGLAVTAATGLATILILEFLKPHWRKLAASWRGGAIMRILVPAEG